VSRSIPSCPCFPRSTASLRGPSCVDGGWSVE
jgi:hypothetical protein